jgi:hypothetical protein
VRRVVRHVLSHGRPLDASAVNETYLLFRQEKSFEERTIPAEPPLDLEQANDEAEESMGSAEALVDSGFFVRQPGWLPS